MESIPNVHEQPQNQAFDPFRFACSVNPVVFTFRKGQLCCLIVDRAQEPQTGHTALPGRFITPEEDPEQVVRGLIRDCTGIENPYLKQVRAFGEIGRHPIGRVISIGFYALVRWDDAVPADTRNHHHPRWVPLENLPDLALDHSGIVRSALRRLRRRIQRKPVGLELLPKQFTLGDLQTLYESLLGEALDKRNFRRKVLKSGAFVATGEYQQRESRRPAKFYTIHASRYAELRERGENFAP